MKERRSPRAAPFDSARSMLSIGRRLRRPDTLQEAFDLPAQGRRVGRQLAGCGQHLGGRRTGMGGRALDLDDALGHLLRAAGGLADIAGDLLRGRLLLLDRGGHVGGDLVHLLDGEADLADGVHGRPWSIAGSG